MILLVLFTIAFFDDLRLMLNTSVSNINITSVWVINFGDEDYSRISLPCSICSLCSSIIFMNFGSFLVIFIFIIQTKHERKTQCLFVNTDQLHLSKITVALFVLLGSANGLVQIQNAMYKRQSEVIFSSIFESFAYSFEASEEFSCLLYSQLIKFLKNAENVLER